MENLLKTLVKKILEISNISSTYKKYTNIHPTPPNYKHNIKKINQKYSLNKGFLSYPLFPQCIKIEKFSLLLF